MYIRYQTIFSEKINFKESLVNVLQEALATYGNVDRDSILYAISLEYIKEIKGKWLIGFTLTWEGENKKIIFSLEDLLKSNEKIIYLVKYYEESLCDELNKYHREIFKLEMKLREIITVVFAEKYHNDLYNFLSEVEIRPSYEDKSISKDIHTRARYLKSRLENEFFYLLFSDYIKLLKLKDLSIEMILRIIQTAAHFKELKEYIINRGITKKEYQDFLSSLKEHLNNIEIVRNCVAHNRNPKDDEVINYDYSMEELNNKLDDFLEGLKNQTTTEYNELL